VVLVAPGHAWWVLIGVIAPWLACTSRGTAVPVAEEAGVQNSVPAIVTTTAARPRVRLAAGLQQTCAVIDGQVLCWGYNGHGELGDGTREDRRVPAPVLGVNDAVAVVTGSWHGCALRQGGTVMCWGDATRGQVGDGEVGTRLVAVAVPGLTGVSALSAAGTQTCALDHVGKVRCWGDRHGDADDEQGSARPREIAGIVGATAVAAGQGYGCAVIDGHVRCWGQAPLPDGAVVGADVPGVSGAVEVAAGDRHVCVRSDAGRVQCWGQGREGQRGDGLFDAMPQRWHGPHPPPMPRTAQTVATVTGLEDVVRLAAGSDFSCALRGDGSLRCWGADRDGQLGDGGDAPRATPVVVPVAPVADLSLGAAHACAVLRAGDVQCWGYNDSGQADNAAPGRVRGPYVAFAADVPGDRSTGGPSAARISALASSGRHACVVRGGAVECLGDNRFGQLGDGTWTTRAAPVRVQGISDAVEVIAGTRHSCARRASGEVMCWGDDTFGQLGQPGVPVGESRDEHGMGPPPAPVAERSRPSPVMVAGLSGARQLVAQGSYTCALQDAGVLRCWHGEGAAALAEPLQLPADTVEVGMGAVHNCARRSTGEVVCWGLNFYGRIGDGTRVDRPRPTAVKGLGDATGLALGLLHSCALRQGGRVACWGSGFGGRLGDGNEEERATIVAVQGLADAIAVVAGEDHGCALRSGGEVVCWGSNGEGALGDGSEHTRLVPGPVIGLAPATAVAAGEQHSCALLRSPAEVVCWGRDLRALDSPRSWDVARAPATISGLSGQSGGSRQ